MLQLQREQKLQLHKEEVGSCEKKSPGGWIRPLHTFACSFCQISCRIAGDWFAGCVPLACLGKDDDLRMMLKMLFWLGMGRDLVGLDVARLNPSDISMVRVSLMGLVFQQKQMRAGMN